MPIEFGHVVVVELADARGEIAAEPERLRQADVLRDGLPEDLRIGEDAGAVRIQPGEHGIAARPAERECAIGALEPHAARGKLVDVRRLRARVTVAAEPVVQIVGDEEQNIPPGHGVGGQDDCLT